LDRWVIHIR